MPEPLNPLTAEELLEWKGYAKEGLIEDGEDHLGWQVFSRLISEVERRRARDAEDERARRVLAAVDQYHVELFRDQIATVVEELDGDGWDETDIRLLKMCSQMLTALAAALEGK